MVTRLLGRKLGMSQIYTEKGQCFPVTVLEAGPCVVTQVKTKENDGYTAVQIAFGERRPKNISRAELGHVIPKGELKADERKKALTRQI
jgi:large subunit ribosomal protein L3